MELERNSQRERQQAEEDARKNMEAKRTALLRRQAEQMIKQQQQQHNQARKSQKSRAAQGFDASKTPKQESKLTIRPVVSGAQSIAGRVGTTTPNLFTPSPPYMTVPGKPGILVRGGFAQSQNLLQSYQQQFGGTQKSTNQRVYKTSTPVQVPVSVARPLPLGKL